MRKVLAGVLFITSFAYAAASIPVAVTNAFVKLPQGPNTAAYMTLTNTGTEPIRLTGASCTFADKVELHTHTNDNGVMKMRSVSSIEIKPGESITLKPGEDHIMFFEADKEQLREGETVPVILNFEGHAPIEVDCQVKRT